MTAAEPWLLDAIKRLAREHTRTPSKPPIIFEQTEEAAKENAATLASFDFDLGRMIAKHSDSTLGYGSEFRTVEQLRPLLGRHPNFGSLSLVLAEGMPYSFKTELDLVTISTKRKLIIARGNHKSAKEKNVELIIQVNLLQELSQGITRYPTPALSQVWRCKGFHWVLNVLLFSD